MRVVTLEQGFGLENVSLETRAEPSYGPRDVLVRGRVVSLNSRDVMMAKGTDDPRQKLGAHHVLELGGAQTIAHSVRAVRIGGTASVIGVLSGALPSLDLRPILMQDLRLQGVLVGSRATFLGVLELVRERGLQPQIDRALADARAAFAYAESGPQFGKVVISLD